MHTEGYLSMFYVNCHEDLELRPARDGNIYEFLIVFRTNHQLENTTVM